MPVPLLIADGMQPLRRLFVVLACCALAVTLAGGIWAQTQAQQQAQSKSSRMARLPREIDPQDIAFFFPKGVPPQKLEIATMTAFTVAYEDLQHDRFLTKEKKRLENYYGIYVSQDRDT